MRTDIAPLNLVAASEFWLFLVLPGSGFFMLPPCFLLQQMVSSTGVHFQFVTVTTMCH